MAAKATRGELALEKVFGITLSSSSGLCCDPKTGLVAYPAGCTVVIFNPKKGKQTHIFNASRKPVASLAFSPDGKYLVTGESGHMPAVRVWDLADRTQISEFQRHKYGISCVAFSPNMKYVVSVGYQHDMTVNVWDWKKNTLVAFNKVSSKVAAVSFSSDSSYFVTVGNRHVRFWYLDASNASKANLTVPLLGRSGLLGVQCNNFFCDVACGEGKMSSSTYCITLSGLLCVFNDKRMLEKFVDLKTPMASCIHVSEELIFCGCANGVVCVFGAEDLRNVAILPRPHCLGVDVALGLQASHLFASKAGARYPDTVALTYDPSNAWLTCVYNDHSLYTWDVRDARHGKRFGKVYSALYHSSCIWGVEVYPLLDQSSSACLPAGSFLTCSSDSTIRVWSVDVPAAPPAPHGNRNIYSNELLKVMYCDESLQSLQDLDYNPAGSADKTDRTLGVRALCVSPDGQHLASGDRVGTVRIHDLQFLDEVMQIDAHNSEVLCLEYSQPETGMKLLASASRDRLIHVLDADDGYDLMQTLDDHSSSITAVKFIGDAEQLSMVSCGADKSIYFRTALKSAEGPRFSRVHHVVTKATLYDMDVDATGKYAVVCCQDRNVRIFDVSSGKQKKCYKGSQGKDGCLIKLQMDPSGMYVATSCSDKNLLLFDFYTGECVASAFGHSEIVTGMKFSHDCKHLISVSGDSCMFLWRLPSALTSVMRQRLAEMGGGRKPVPPKQPPALRRETYVMRPRAAVLGNITEHSEEEEAAVEERREDDEEEEEDTEESDWPPAAVSLDDCIKRTTKTPAWARLHRAPNGAGGSQEAADAAWQPRRRWGQGLDKEQTEKSLQDLCRLSVETPSPSPRTDRESCGSLDSRDGTGGGDDDAAKLVPTDLNDLFQDLDDDRRESEPFSRPGRSETPAAESAATSPEPDTPGDASEDIIYTQPGDADTAAGSDYQVTEIPKSVRGKRSPRGHARTSPNRAAGGASPARDVLSPSPHPAADLERPDLVDGSSELSKIEEDIEEDDGKVDDGEDDEEEEEEEDEEEEPEDCPNQEEPPQMPKQETFLKQNFETLADYVRNEMFNHSLEELCPNPQPRREIALNPRLSISSRFLFKGFRTQPREGRQLPTRPRLLPANPVPDRAATGVSQPTRLPPTMESSGKELSPPIVGSRGCDEVAEAPAGGGDGTAPATKSSSDRELGNEAAPLHARLSWAEAERRAPQRRMLPPAPGIAPTADTPPPRGSDATETTGSDGAGSGAAVAERASMEARDDGPRAATEGAAEQKETAPAADAVAARGSGLAGSHDDQERASFGGEPARSQPPPGNGTEGDVPSGLADRTTVPPPGATDDTVTAEETEFKRIAARCPAVVPKERAGGAAEITTRGDDAKLPEAPAPCGGGGVTASRGANGPASAKGGTSVVNASDEPRCAEETGTRHSGQTSFLSAPPPRAEIVAVDADRAPPARAAEGETPSSLAAGRSRPGGGREAERGSSPCPGGGASPRGRTSEPAGGRAGGTGGDPPDTSTAAEGRGSAGISVMREPAAENLENGSRPKHADICDASGEAPGRRDRAAAAAAEDERRHGEKLSLADRELGGDTEPPLTEEKCKLVLSELRSALHAALHLYEQVSAAADSERHAQMSAAMLRGFSYLGAELESVVRLSSPDRESNPSAVAAGTTSAATQTASQQQQQQQDCGSRTAPPQITVAPIAGSHGQPPPPCAELHGWTDGKTVNLLEHYSDLMVQLVERKMACAACKTTRT